MSNFITVNDWMMANIVSIETAEDVTPELLRELQVMADEENETLQGRAFTTLKDYQRQDGMRALGAIQLNTHDPRKDNYMDNAFAIVILKADPHGTDGIFVIIQVVPERYVLKTIIRANKDYVATHVTHTYMSLFESSLTKPFMITGVHNGNGQQRIFADKSKHDNLENIDPELEPGTNDAFTIKLPNGETIEP